MKTISDENKRFVILLLYIATGETIFGGVSLLFFKIAEPVGTYAACFYVTIFCVIGIIVGGKLFERIYT